MRFDTPYNIRSTPPHRSASAGVKPEGSSMPSGARSWNSWWSRRSPNIRTNDNPPVCAGIDAGSKTIKLVTVDADGNIVHGHYHRHRSDVRTTLAELLRDVVWRYGDMQLPLAITGSAGIALAEELGIPFVQEVVATTNAVKARFPQANCIIELGGEDAKITYLDDPVEQRMNATCAGGTGDFIDGIASMLGVRTRDFSKLALGHSRTYPIASRCAVFAQTDVRPLINAGAKKADIAQSALEAVVRQTLGGLACGRPIRGTVVFLGGPLEHIPALVMAFRRKLGLDQQTGIKPADAHLFAAMGAIETATGAPAVSLAELEQRIRTLGVTSTDEGALPPLFDDESQVAAFKTRHSQAGAITSTALADASGNLYLGFDAGSTTCKYALIDEAGALVASDYREVEGDSFETARAMVEGLCAALESKARLRGKARLAYATVTGYGEDLLRAGLGFDSGVVETVAHLRAAQSFRPDATFVLDIGGQDMKALWIRDGVVVDAVLNEACSSGCGAFVQSSAKSLLLSNDAFSKSAFEAAHPIDLGAKCTVFMTSRVRHAQKTGASEGDIAAGIAYSVVNNVMTRIIGSSHALPLGDAVVVQGGTFKSDAVLRAFEKRLNVEAIRPAQAHLMGAYGAAIIAKDRAKSRLQNCSTEIGSSSLLSLEEIRRLSTKKSSAQCSGCGNACLVSVVDFGNGRRFISGNRCERAYRVLFGEAHVTEEDASAPNIVALEQALIGSHRTIDAAGARGSIRIGLMNAMNVYESTPFWHTLITCLGFSIIMPDDSRAQDLRDRAAETIPSESVCHPAKLTHARYADLIAQGADIVFMPQFERGTRCPVACEYACALRDNVENPRMSSPTIKAIRPKAFAKFPKDIDTLFETVNSWLSLSVAPGLPAVGHDEFDEAFGAALEAQAAFESKLARSANDVSAWLEANPHRRAAVIAGRPYHIDPALIRQIDCELVRLGFAVIPMLALEAQLHSIRGKRSLWKPSKHLCELVEYTADNPQLEIVALRSFGCLYDAVSFDEAHDLANSLRRPFTELKLDDIADRAHIRIRLRTLAYTSSLKNVTIPRKKCPIFEGAGASVTTPDLCSTAKELVKRARSELADQPDGKPLRLPRICLDCLTDALPFELKHLGMGAVEIEPEPSSPLLQTASIRSESENAASSARPKVGLVGNPLLVFDEELNEHVADLVASLGWQAVYPEPSLIEVEDVRYLDQLQVFHNAGVERIIYLQSFGCLKGHVKGRGSLHELSSRFPDMPITVVDYDPESSALNRENRIRLALAKTEIDMAH